MKPNFALTLSFESIGLLHRSFPGWRLVGEVAFDSDDLAGDLAKLREKAVQLDPDNLYTKLVVPNDQVKYLAFDSTDIARDDLESAVMARLDKATPYHVKYLAADWSVEDGQVRVAAVARRTLTEAEAFATEHQFNPVCFVASPDAGDFQGEPYFGETSGVEPDEAVGRDDTPVRIIGAVSQPEYEQAPEEDAAPQPGQIDAEHGTASEDETPVDELENTPDAGFASIRARRGDMPAAAPRLAGAARFFKAEPEPPAPGPEAPEPKISGVTDAAIPAEGASDTGPSPEPVIASPAPDDTSKKPAPGPAFTTSRSARKARIEPTLRAPDPINEKMRMTVFGARDNDLSEDRPRHMALVLTAVFLISLVGAATWASLYLEGGLSRFFVGSDAAQIADLPEAGDKAPDVADPAGTAGIDQTNIETEELPAEKQDDEELADEVMVASLPQPVEEAEPEQETPVFTNPSELSPDQARARYAATGIWQMAPESPLAPAPTGLEGFYQTSIDRSVNFQDAVALPDVEALLGDIRPATPVSPPRAGTEFDLDERGLVIATISGAMTPDGILVYAGRPSIIPPERPEPAAQAALPEAAVDAQQLRAVRPKLRPDDLTELNERNALGGRTRSELATMRPKLRPQSAQEAAIDAAVTEATQSDDPLAGAMPQAVTASLRPATRPEHFARIVKQSQPTQDQTVAVSAVQKVTPSIPTTASVARAATQTNAIKLRKVNLIGVYGTPNSRRALVRLSNGRYRKVQVGDRLDGGKVAAIGNDELRYVKRGRNVVLKMPKG